MRDESDRDQQPMRDEYEIYKRYGLYGSLGGDTKKYIFPCIENYWVFQLREKINKVDYIDDKLNEK